MVLFDTIKDSQIFYVKSINCYELSFHYCPVKAGKSVFEIVET